MKDDEDIESHQLYSKDWMNSKGIAEALKCSRFCMTIGGDART